MKSVLTIAGFDPSSGAGVSADLMVFAAHGLFGTACITALTVQSTLGVLSTHPISTAVVDETLYCLDGDIPPSGVKIGMMATHTICLSISRYCAKHNALNVVRGHRLETPIVLDPVLRSSSGRELLDPAGLGAIRERLLPEVNWVTPNLHELAILAGERVETRSDIERVSRALCQQVARKGDMAPLGVVVTGGHRDPPDDYMLMPDGRDAWFAGERIDSRSTHGTGCAFSSAFLSRLVLGDAPYEACLGAKAYVAGAIENAVAIGGGAGPINHLWRISQV